MPEEYTPKLIVFKEVPGFDKRTLVLSYGEESLDLQFCSCANKYKKRFVSFLSDNPGVLEQIRDAAVSLKDQGHVGVDIKDILEYLRTKTKLSTPIKEYFQKFSHDFELDTLPRAYLVRKLMMEDPRLFNFFQLAPLKCRSNCGYPSDTEPEREDSTDIAGF